MVNYKKLTQRNNMNARELHYKLFGDELDDTVNAFAYSMFTSRIKQPAWKTD